MSQGKRFNLTWLIFFACLAVALVWKVSEASDPDIKQEATTTVTTDVGDQIIGGQSNRSVALSSSLGDVDIADCVISKQFSFVVIVAWQNYDYNLWCMAAKLDILGKHDEAAVIRCRIPELRKAFPDDCEYSMLVHSEPIKTPELEALYSQAAQYEESKEEEDIRYQQQQQEIEYVTEQLASVVEKLDRQKSAQTRTQRAPEPYISEQQKAELREIFKK